MNGLPIAQKLSGYDKKQFGVLVVYKFNLFFSSKLGICIIGVYNVEWYKATNKLFHVAFELYGILLVNGLLV